MASTLDKSFCLGESILDKNELWNTTTPFINRCLQRTIPYWIPSIFLWLVGPIQLYLMIRKYYIPKQTKYDLNRRLIEDNDDEDQYEDNKENEDKVDCLDDKQGEDDLMMMVDTTNLDRHNNPSNNVQHMEPNGRKRHKRRTIPYNIYNICRLVSSIAVILLNIVHFVYDFHYYANPDHMESSSIADLSSSVLNTLTWSLFTILIYLHRKFAINTSGTAWLFTFLSVTMFLPLIYAYAMFYEDEMEPIVHGSIIIVRIWKPIDLIFNATHFGLILIVFSLTCFADRFQMTSNGSVTKQSIKSKKSLNGNDNRQSIMKPFIMFNQKKTTKQLDLNHKICDSPLLWHSNSSGRESPEKYVSFLSRITYCWFNRLIQTGYRRTLTIGNMWLLSSSNRTKNISKKFDLNWNRKTNDDSVAKVETLKTLIRTFGWQFIAGASCKLAYDLMLFINPQLLKFFIAFISNPNEPIWHGYFIASLFFILATIQSTIFNYYFHKMNIIGMQIRTALISAIYRKSLHLNNESRSQRTSGEIVNLMTVDAQRFLTMIPYINLIWSAPFQIALTIYFLWIELGPSVLAGLTVMLAMIPINVWISTIQRRFQVRAMTSKDERIKVINEILSGIRVLKFNGWEIPFITRIGSIRQQEMKHLQSISIINAFSSIMWTCSPFLVSLVTFSVYVLVSEDNVLNAERAFVSLALFELLRFPLSMLPEVFSIIINISVTRKRLDRYLNCTPLSMYVTRDRTSTADDDEYSITVKNGSFTWHSTTDKIEVDSKRSLLNGLNKSSIILHGINLKIRRGSLLAIVGHVGSGKSSLLSAILGDMERVDGSVNVERSERIGYVAQQPWIQNATLRDNILFGSKYDMYRYNQVLEMCALKPDISALPGGDRTEIGENGINLSGGQKQRISIARACYSKTSTILLDDPLSAVDAHVGEHIFRSVLSNKTGILRNRTRVLVTNQLSNLEKMDQIVMLANRTIAEMGTYDELMAKNGKFAQLINDYVTQNDRLKEQVHTTKEDTNEQKLNNFKRRSSSIMSQQSEQRQNSLSHLIEVEQSSIGNVKWSIYVSYFKTLTITWIILILTGYIGLQIISVSSNIWLARWSNDQTSMNDTIENISQRNYRVTIYAYLGIAQALSFFIGAYALVKGTINSSKMLHSNLLYRIMRSPISFFDTTPLGRIVNRFSKDIETIDSLIPKTIDGWLICFLQVVATIVLITFHIPLFLIVIIPIVALYFMIYRYYVTTSRQLSRLESTTKSPIFSHFRETLSGVSTIRAFNVIQDFILECNRRVDINHRCYYLIIIANRWLSFRLEFCGNLIVLFTTLFSVYCKADFETMPGYIGLIITYSLSITGVLNWCVRMTSEMESNVVAVERIGEYCSQSMEKEWNRPINHNPMVKNDWPSMGVIEFKDLSLRYRKGLNLVLKDVSFKTKPCERIGIIGRTGSGKSTLTLALFRLIEASNGSINIDGIDISQIGLHELRSRISIIPQDPILFSGTIRTNLDPFGSYPDQMIWHALDHCHLKQYVTEQGGLDHPIDENGSNLSVGQRQLLCLGRALLRRTSILILDEATASIDLETDSIIQRTIREQFNRCTVMTIAHRLNTIIDYDRILVLTDGRVVEFDTPNNLLNDDQSKFYSLAKDARLI